MQTKKIQYLAYLGLITAVMVIMTITRIGFIPLGPLSISIMTVPIIVAATTLGKWAGVYAGAVFGILSFAMAFQEGGVKAVMASSFPVLMFCVCVVPRVLVGFTAGFSFFAFKKKFKNREWGYWVTAAITPLTNTILFLPAYAGIICYSLQSGIEYPAFKGLSYGTLLALITGGALVNIVVELLSAVLIAVPVAKAVKMVLNRHTDFAWE